MKPVAPAGRRSPARNLPVPPPTPRLRLTPYAWAKLVHLRDRGDSEIGGFGISDPADLLLVRDLALVRQRCDWASVEFDDQAVAEYFDEQIDAGRRPAEFGRIWMHTHPGQSPQPSLTDEATFDRVFARCDWAVMFILARGGQPYARLRFGVGPGGALAIPVEVDFGEDFRGSDPDLWRVEYDACVQIARDDWLHRASLQRTGDFEWDDADMVRA